MNKGFMNKSVKLLLINFFILNYIWLPTVIAEQPPQGARGGGGGNLGFGTVIGILIDNETENPLMFASAVLHRVNDSAMVSGAITDERGRFIIEDVPRGRYYLQLQFVGYPSQKYNGISITREDPVYDAGVIQITPAAEQLSEVIVEGARQMMEVGLDRRVINVGQELTSVGGTALELMQNIPSVSVDFDGNVSLRGSDNVTILVDGRPSSLVGLDDNTVLEQIPSEMIERIEIITNPSVRYNPDGTAGIINIVTKKEKRPGYNGMINLSAGTNNRYSGSVNFNYRPVDNFNIFGNVSGRFFNMTGWGKSERTNQFDNPGGDIIEYEILQNSEFDRSMDTYNFQLGFDYTFNKKNTVTVSTRFSDWKRYNFDEQEYEFLNDPRNREDFLRLSDNNMARQGFDYSLNYKRIFDQKHRELNFDIRYSDGSFLRSEDNQSFYITTINSNPYLIEDIENESTNNRFIAELDYVHPINETGKIEGGLQAQYRSTDNDFIFYNINPENSDRFFDENRSDHFVYEEQRYSAYGIYSTSLGKYNLQTGLRVEQAVMKGEQLKMEDGDFDKEYFSYFPSAHIRRNFENNQNAQISYSKRISRPRRWALNPFTRYSDPYNLSRGNPALLPEYIHSLELSYTKFWENTTVNPSIFYRYTDQMMSRYSIMDDEGVTVTTWENVGYAINYGAELIASQTVTDWWRVNGNFSYFHRIVQGNIHENEYTDDSYSWNARMTNNFNFGNKFSMQVSGYYRSPVVMLQGRLQEMYSADIGMRYNILNNSGSITLRVSDVFNTQRFNMYIKGDNFEMYRENRRRSRMVYIGLSYRLHDFRPDRDRNRSDVNDIEPDGFDAF